MGVFLSATVFVRFIYETATEAKALAVVNRNEILSIKTQVADKVADRIIEQNNLLRNHIDNRFDTFRDSINERLNRIESSLKQHD